MININTLKAIPTRLGDFADVLIPGIAIVALLVVVRGAATAGHKSSAGLPVAEVRQCVLAKKKASNHWALGLGQIYQCMEKKISKDDIEDLRVSRSKNNRFEATYTISNSGQRQVVQIEAPEF